MNCYGIKLSFLNNHEALDFRLEIGISYKVNVTSFLVWKQHRIFCYFSNYTNEKPEINREAFIEQ